MTDSDMTDRELRIAIARAKWSVEYDAQQIKETQERLKRQGVLNRWLSGPAVDADVQREEYQALQENLAALEPLEHEARRRGIDSTNIPARSNADYWGDL